MPSWQPTWSDVDFDHAAAEAAARELETTARVLSESAGPLHRSAENARLEWQGRHRERFDEELLRLAREREALIAALLGDAHRIRQSSADARLEQRRREDTRERWQREAAAERTEAERTEAERNAAERAVAERLSVAR